MYGGEECRTKGVSKEDILLEAAFDLSYDIAHWLECAAHFFSRSPNSRRARYFVDCQQVLGLEALRADAG